MYGACRCMVRKGVPGTRFSQAVYGVLVVL